MRPIALVLSILLFSSYLLGTAYTTANVPLNTRSNSQKTQQAPSTTHTNPTTTSSSSSSNRALLETQLVPTAACGKLPSEPLSQAITSCLSWQQQVGCGFLEAQGYIPVGVQSLTSHSLSGNLTAPETCGSSTVSLLSKRRQQQQQQQQQLVFDAGGRAVLAVIARGTSSTAYFFGRGAHQGLINLQQQQQQQQPLSLELCLAPPAEGSLTAQQSATYSPRLAPGSVSWSLSKTVQLPPAYTDGLVNMIQGDTVEAAWTLAATKSGDEPRYQGVVSGRISITNSKAVPVALYGVLTAIKGGPSATVTCGPTMPFKVQPCTTIVCSFTATYPQPPPAGQYTATSTVQYQQLNSARIDVAEVQTAFKVPKGPVQLPPAAAKVPAGQAVVTDTQLPGQVLTYTGTGQQSYVTLLSCPSSGSVVNTAKLLAATGQEAIASANVQKHCHKLDVRLQEVGEPVVARWHWSVRHVASITQARLRSAVAARSSASIMTQGTGNQTLPAQLFKNTAAAGYDDDLTLPTTEDVTYTVHVTRSFGQRGREAPFTLSGKVTVTNPAPKNAKLATVTITLTDPAGQLPALRIPASCPMLAVASGQSLTCRWTTTPSFNPIGGTVVATARYLASRNGDSASGDIVDFESASLTVGDAPDQQQADTDAETTSSATFGRTFLPASFKRVLLQWLGNGPSSSPPTFNPAGFLTRVWGQTGANTVVSSAVQPSLTAPAMSQHSPYAAGASMTSFAAPAPLTTLATERLGKVASSYSNGSPAALVSPGHAQPRAGAGMSSYSSSWPRQPSTSSQHKAAAAASPSTLGATSHAGRGSSAAAAAGTAAASAPLSEATASRLRVAAPGYGAAAGAAGTGAATAAAEPQPAGLLDDCADLSHELAFEPGLLPGRLVSGRPPTGRICGSSTFVYSVRYGPYESCGTGSKAAAAVQLLTGDTRRVRSSVAEVGISVQGCKPGVDAVVAAARPAADVTAAWDMQMRAQHARLQLQPGQIVSNSYSVSYSRQLTASSPRLFVIISLKNTGHSTPLIGDARYFINGTCGDRGYERASAFACSNNKVAPGGAVNCSFVAPLPCAAGGLLQAQLQLSTGEVVRTPVAEFAAPDLEQLVAAGRSRSACIKATYGSAASNSKAHKQGKLLSGQLPKGLLCAPREFSITRQFGPYDTCRHRNAQVTAGFETADGVARQETLLIALDTVGCKGSRGAVGTAAAAAAAAGMAKPPPKPPGSKATSAAVAIAAVQPSRSQHSSSSGSDRNSTAVGRGSRVISAVAGSSQPPRGSCVYQPWFWKHCMLPDLHNEPVCAVVNTSLPGGQGAKTPFFPYRKYTMVRRTYRQLMVAPKKTGNRIVDLHFFAAKVFIATQMNHYAGVAMPDRVREAYVLLGRQYFSVYDDRSAAEELPHKPEVQQRVAAAAQVLAAYTSGKHPGLPTCAAVQRRGKPKQGQLPVRGS